MSENEQKPEPGPLKMLLDAASRADALLGHLMKSVPWGKTYNVDFAELNGVLCELPRVVAGARASVDEVAKLKAEAARYREVLEEVQRERDFVVRCNNYIKGRVDAVLRGES